MVTPTPSNNNRCAPSNRTRSTQRAAVIPNSAWNNLPRRREPTTATRAIDTTSCPHPDRPDTTFGNVKADVPAHYLPGFVPGDFVKVIQNSDWPE